MIQRIQTIFLALAAGANLSVFGLPFAEVNEKIANSTLFTNDLLYNLQDNTILLVAYALSGVLALVAIFLFKNRKQQMLVTRIAAVVTIISVVLTVVFFWQDYQTLAANTAVDDGIGAYTPVIGVILLFLANFYIGKDEKLVRSSYDRLR